MDQQVKPRPVQGCVSAGVPAEVSFTFLFYILHSGTHFSKVPETFGARKALFVSFVCIQDRGFNSFEGNTTQLLVSEIKRTGLQGFH